MRKLLSFPGNPAVVVVHYWKPSLGHFWVTSEDEIDVIAKYYSLPSVSFRNTFFQAVTQKMPGFRAEDFMSDKTHPNALGSQYLAYTVISLFEAVLAGLPGRPVASELEAVLPPMIPGNVGNNQTFCARKDKLKEFATHAHSWTWSSGEKAGWVAEAVGADLHLFAALDSAGEYQLTLGYLQSQKSMGMANVTCRGVCICPSHCIDAYHTKDTSIQVLHPVNVTAAHAGRCILSIRISDSTSSLGHNFKILSLGLGEDEVQIQDLNLSHASIINR